MQRFLKNFELFLYALQLLSFRKYITGKSYIIGELLLTRIWKFAILKVNTKYLEPL